MDARTESERAPGADQVELRANATTDEQRAYRRAADAQIAHSEAKFRRLFEAAHDGILILDAVTGEITAANPFLTQLLGYSEAEMLGKKLWEIGPFQDAATSRIAFKDLQANEHIRYEELSLQMRDGRIVDVEFVSNVYEANAEKVIQCNIRDISERKRTEEATYLNARVTSLRAAVGLSLSEPGPFADSLRGCAEAFVMHFSASLAQIWIHDPGGTGLTLAANAGIAAQPDVTLDGVPPGHSMIQQIVATGTRVVTNSALFDSQVSDHGWAVREGITAFAGFPLQVDGHVVGVLALFAREPLPESVLATLNSLPNHLALTIERRLRLRDIESAEERLRFAMQSAHVGFWDLDCTNRRLSWSPIMEEQFGLSPGSFDGTFDAFVKLVHPDDREATLATIEEAQRSGKDYSVRYRTLRSDGTVRWLRGEGRYVLDAEGKFVRASGISLDVTEQVALQAQDQQAQKMEAIGRLAGGVAHDFNNLLTVMLGFCELVLGSLRKYDPNYSDIVEIQKAGLRAAALTRQLLTFSRRTVVESRLLDVNEIVKSLLPMLERLIGEGVQVSTRLHDGVAPIRADRGQIEQVIMNLVVNARDSMPKGGTLTIESDLVELDEDYVAMHLGAKVGSYVALTVTDTGHGMDGEVLKHLFEPFFTTKPLGEGTGLGLATVHGIVLQNHGTIGVYSEVDRGTSFKVYLPLEISDDEPSSAVPPPAPPVGGSETVLVVEDSAPLLALTQRVLEQAGYAVIVAADATEAAARFAAAPTIALVLTDVVMPGDNGPDLVARLRLQRPETKVVYMSGYPRDAISQHGVLEPGIAFIQKPFSATALKLKVREELDA